MLSEKGRKILHLIIGIISAVLIVALGIGMMVSCWGIYQCGPRAFSRETIGAALTNPVILILIFMSVVSCLLGILVHLILPVQKSKTKAIRDELTVMQKMSEKVGAPSQEQKAKITRESWLRRITWIIFGILAVSAAVFPALYLFNVSHFPGVDPTAEIMTASFLVMPYGIFLLGCYFAADLVCKYSAIRQTAVYKQMLLEKNLRAADAAAGQMKSGTWIVTGLRLALIAVAICFIVAGIFNGSADDVLTKAIKICTECIGLG